MHGFEFMFTMEEDKHAAVLPILASNELAAHIKRQQQKKRYTTTCIAIDEAFNGGIESGAMTCISGDRETGKSTIALHLIAGTLQRSAHAEAVVIDTTGSFDVFRLHQIAMSRVRGGMGEEERSMLAEEMLARLKIMRVFDFDGVLDAVAEVGGELESAVEARRVGHGVRRSGERGREVPDSEDEDGAGLSSDGSEEGRESLAAGQRRVEMLLIDNLTAVVNPLMKSNHVRAQSQLVTFLRSLRSLTRQFNLLTLLLNGVIHQQHNSAAQSTTNTYQAVPEISDSPSIFAANDFRPALGRTFLHFIDLHILLSILPKNEQDARIKYDRDASSRDGKARLSAGQIPDMMNVLEVIADRFSNRTGSWTAFRIERGLDLL